MDRIESLPLFPLSDVVLLPEVSVPLNIFEPRYRQMTRDALAGERRIGMVTVHPDGFSAMGGDPPLYPIGCLGRIDRAEEQPDGTFRILLQGERRFSIVEEHPRSADRLYRCARVALLSDELPLDEDGTRRLATCRDELLALLGRLIESVDRNGAGAETVEAFGRLESARMVNALSQAVAFRAAERQRLLESDTILGRFETMLDLLRFRLAEVRAGEAGSGHLAH
jgi:hypothetical protein